MRRVACISVVAMVLFGAVGIARQAGSGGPYKVLKTARVGGEGGWDYIYADVDGRRLYIPRGASREVAATATSPAADDTTTGWMLRGSAPPVVG